MTTPTATPQRLHDRLGAMIDQLGYPDCPISELIEGLRGVRDDLLALSDTAGRNEIIEECAKHIESAPAQDAIAEAHNQWAGRAIRALKNAAHAHGPTEPTSEPIAYSQKPQDRTVRYSPSADKRSEEKIAEEAIDLFMENANKHGMTYADAKSEALRDFREAEQLEQWAVFCAVCSKQWAVPYRHPGRSICEECEKRARSALSATALMTEDEENFLRDALGKHCEADCEMTMSCRCDSFVERLKRGGAASTRNEK